MAHSTRVQAEDAFKRMKQLHDKGSLPEIKWVETQSQLQQAVSAENIARKNLGDCNLYAPFDGIISEKNAEIGQNAAPGMPIAKLVTTRVLNVKIRVEGATDGLLPGMVSNVSLGKVASASSVSNGNSAIVIPASLVQLGDDNSNFVWIDESGKAVHRTIVCGEYQSNGVSIVSGLKIGDKLIVEGQQKVCTGTPLKAIVP